MYRVAGGQVGCRCTGQQIELNGAWPDEGWTVRSSTSDGGTRLRVEFESGDARTRVEATCVDGGPSASVEDTSSGGDGSGGGGGGEGRRRGRGRRLSPPAGQPAVAASTSIHMTSQTLPSGSVRLRPYM